MFPSYGNQSADWQSKSKTDFFMIGTFVVKGLLVFHEIVEGNISQCILAFNGSFLVQLN